MTKYDLILTDDQFITDRHGVMCLTAESGPKWVGQLILNAGTGVEYTVVDISDGIVRLAREPKPQVHDE